MTSNCKRRHRLLQGLLMGLLGMASWVVQAAPNAYYIHNDHRGAPIVMTNANKTVVWQVAYKPYGEVVPIVSSADLDIRYPGQRQDDGTGLYYNHYRDYDPKLGRYVQSDPIGLEGGINTYAYALGNPIMNIDPLGLAPPIGPGGVRSPLNCTEGFCPNGPGGWAGKVGGLAKECPEILESSRAARRGAMRERGVPTSRPTESQKQNSNGTRQDTVKDSQGKDSVQSQHSSDPNHPYDHWHSAAPKIDPLTGAPRTNRHGAVKYDTGGTSVSYK